jgi:antitoxin VapB
MTVATTASVFYTSASAVGIPIYGGHMTISIKNEEAEKLLLEIQAATTRGKSQIVLDLLRSEAARLRRVKQVESLRRRIDAIGKRYVARLPKAPATPEEIIGYDDTGLPK